MIATADRHPTPTRAPLRNSLFAGLAMLLGPALLAQPPDEVGDQGSVDEEITVSETSLLLDFRQILSPRQTRTLLADDIRIFEDKVPRTTVRLEPIIRSTDDRWHLLIYVDSILSSSETVRQAALALAQSIPTMARLGEIRILVNDGQVRELVPATRSVTQLEDALAELGKRPVAFDRLRGLRERFDTDLARAGADDDLAVRLQAVAQEEELVRRQGDALLRAVGSGCPADACSLFLVSDGFDLHPELYYLGSELAERHPDSGVEAQRTAVGLAESLSALEWITLTVPLVQPRTPTPTKDKPRGSPDRDHDLFLQQTGAYFDGITIRRKHERSNLDSLSLKEMSAYLLPTLQPLRMLAEETSGKLLTATEQIDEELTGLSQRLRVWYRTTRPLDGQLRPVEASLVADNRPIRSPFWSDASTPEGVAEARARGILAGLVEPGPLAVRAELRGTDELLVTVAWGPDSPSHTSGPRLPLRFSVAVTATGKQPSIQHRVEEVATSPDTDATAHQIEIDPVEGSGEMVVLVEDLRLRVWGATRLRRP